MPGGSLRSTERRTRLPTLVRRGREANVTDVSVLKLDAAYDRGFTIELRPSSPPDRRIAQIDREIIEDA